MTKNIPDKSFSNNHASIVLAQNFPMGELTRLVKERFSGRAIALTEEGLAEYTCGEDRLFGMAVRDGVGYGYWYADVEGSELESGYTYVSPEFRNMSIGRTLKLHQIATAHVRGFHWLRGRVEVDNLASIRMHQSLGIEGQFLGKWWHYLINVVESNRIYTGYDFGKICSTTEKILPSSSVAASGMFEETLSARKFLQQGLLPSE